MFNEGATTDKWNQQNRNSRKGRGRCLSLIHTPLKLFFPTVFLKHGKYINYVGHIFFLFVCVWKNQHSGIFVFENYNHGQSSYTWLIHPSGSSRHHRQVSTCPLKIKDDDDLIRKWKWWVNILPWKVQEYNNSATTLLYTYIDIRTTAWPCCYLFFSSGGSPCAKKIKSPHISLILTMCSSLTFCVSWKISV